MLSAVEKGSIMMLTRLNPVVTLIDTKQRNQQPLALAGK